MKKAFKLIGKGMVIGGLVVFAVSLSPFLGPVGIAVVGGYEILTTEMALSIIIAGATVADLGDEKEK